MFGRTAAAMVLATLLMMIETLSDNAGSSKPLTYHFRHYSSLLLKRAASSTMLTVLALAVGSSSVAYGTWGVFHVYEAKMRLAAQATAAAAAAAK